MGKKRVGRKDFLRSGPAGTEPEPEVASQPEPPRKADVVQGSADQDDLDASSRFLKEPEKQATQSASRIDSESVDVANGMETEAPTTPVGVEEKTRGQIVQRHKKELKAHKELVKKLGKKRKDEADQIGKALEARHAAELEAWDAANKEDSLADATLVAPTAGLYDLKIGEEDRNATKKPTKAQRRREHRAAEEAEREARIEEEQAGMGVSEKEQEACDLRDLLRPLRLELCDIPADGHCLYRAVQHQLSEDSTDPVPDYKELREEAASYMRAFPDDFRPFVVQDSEGDPEAAFEHYCRDVEETAAWGGQIELQALAQALERHIRVHAVGLPPVELGEEYKGKAKTLQVCYLRHAFGLGEHYNSVQPAPVDE